MPEPSCFLTTFQVDKESLLFCHCMNEAPGELTLWVTKLGLGLGLSARGSQVSTAEAGKWLRFTHIAPGLI